ncbi:M24 family metallopeptidase [Halalkalicoccus jeotgali]|uniref:Peptidase M24 n=1 Tax=Halalkalicoccus jeotgali (strain DSM 18796 / CECT 7217 / JCM 14584 / KCTC 4019 / B3) TaxID=795797 RepID=D8J6U5_HALJB|nr:Xaa-Pro peptidase family protein [Halalkalicoccus jeotgali]ADJ15898.1 peptidase M24 [Halalkalicoccus jeotgali B3]ELY37994.1 peptidase M24 [Halalkalicoccus jeotgali B3]
MDADYEGRTRACQQALSPEECLVLFPGPNLQYLTGFRDEPMERHFLLFVPREGEPVFLAPTMYDDQLADTWVSDTRLWDDGEDPREYIEEILSHLDPECLLVDDRLWARFTQDLQAVTDAEFGLASEVLADLRLKKDEAEIDAIRRASALTDRVSEEIRTLDAIGMTERDLAREIESQLADAGGEGPSFETIVAAGPNGARPHHRHGDREIEAGDPVVLDFGTRLDGYPSDQTRTVVFGGDPPTGFEAVHDVVREAQGAAVEAIAPGVPAEAVDRAAREVIEDAGYGEQFTHRTGHGVGIEVHEPPYIVDGNSRALEAGMVFSVEPGVYLDGEFGVRIEDLVVVTAEGCERLNDSPRDWR